MAKTPVKLDVPIVDENDRTGGIEGPVPLHLDWESEAGQAHHFQMLQLAEDDPVRQAHEAVYAEEHG